MTSINTNKFERSYPIFSTRNSILVSLLILSNLSLRRKCDFSFTSFFHGGAGTAVAPIPEATQQWRQHSGEAPTLVDEEEEEDIQETSQRLSIEPSDEDLHS